MLNFDGKRSTYIKRVVQKLLQEYNWNKNVFMKLKELKICARNFEQIKKEK